MICKKQEFGVLVYLSIIWHDAIKNAVKSNKIFIINFGIWLAISSLIMVIGKLSGIALNLWLAAFGIVILTFVSAAFAMITSDITEEIARSFANRKAEWHYTRCHSKNFKQ